MDYAVILILIGTVILAIILAVLMLRRFVIIFKAPFVHFIFKGESNSSS